MDETKTWVLRMNERIIFGTMVPKFESIIHHDTKSSVQHPDIQMAIENYWKVIFGTMVPKNQHMLITRQKKLSLQESIYISDIQIQGSGQCVFQVSSRYHSTLHGS